MPKSQRRRRRLSKHNSRRGRKQYGGNGAESYARSVYGNIGEQHALNESNLIASKYINQSGGSKHKKRKHTKKHKGGDNFGDNFGDIFNNMKSDVQNAAKSVSGAVKSALPTDTDTDTAADTDTDTDTDTAADTDTDTAADTAADTDTDTDTAADTNPAADTNTAASGGSMISSLTVPAMFLTANQLYKNRQRSNFNLNVKKSFKKYNKNFRHRVTRRHRRFNRYKN